MQMHITASQCFKQVVNDGRMPAVILDVSCGGYAYTHALKVVTVCLPAGAPHITSMLDIARPMLAHLPQAESGRIRLLALDCDKV
eukprot:363424-Chlamydomonas_euryale.AAC.9